MYNLANNKRRVTQDIDFDLIRYSIDKESIRRFILKLNSLNDGFEILMDGQLEELHHQDYRGLRLHALIKDVNGGCVKIKLDIGVHTLSAIEQEQITFSFETNHEKVHLKVNPIEQIFIEKLISLVRFGANSKRYKDVFDLFYLIDSCGLSIRKTRNALIYFLEYTKYEPHTIFEVQNSIRDIFSDSLYLEKLVNSSANWLDEDLETIISTILSFVDKL